MAEIHHAMSILIIGVLFIIAGLYLNFFPPKKINFFFGYRTPTAKSSQEHWDFAQKYSGKLAWRVGLFIILFGIIVWQLFEDTGQYRMFIDLLPMLVGLIYILSKTEQKLKEM